MPVNAYARTALQYPVQEAQPPHRRAPRRTALTIKTTRIRVLRTRLPQINPHRNKPALQTTEGRPQGPPFSFTTLSSSQILVRKFSPKTNSHFAPASPLPAATAFPSWASRLHNRPECPRM